MFFWTWQFCSAPITIVSYRLDRDQGVQFLRLTDVFVIDNKTGNSMILQRIEQMA